MLINLPYKILVENSVSDKIDEFLQSLRLGDRFALVCSENMRKLVGNSLIENAKSFNSVVINPQSLEKQYLQNLSKQMESFDFIIGLGGGRNIDIAKYVAYLAGKEWIAFPTILSHDGVVSSRAVLNENSAKISVKAKEPIAIIGDLETVCKAPYRYIAAGAGDLISNISAVEDWKIADKAGKEKYHIVMGKLSLLAADAAIEHADDIRNRTAHGMEILLWSLISSGFAMNIYGSSRPCSGSEHNFSHALELLLTANKNAPLHGEQCALGTIATIYLQDGDWESVKNVMRQLDLPTDARKLGVQSDLVVEALYKAKDIRDRYTVLNEKNLSRDGCKAVLEKVGVV